MQLNGSKFVSILASPEPWFQFSALCKKIKRHHSCKKLFHFYFSNTKLKEVGKS